MSRSRFVRIRHKRKVTQSFCALCDRMVGVAADPNSLELAERAHICSTISVTENLHPPLETDPHTRRPFRKTG
jgi:hypothetical protein